MTLHQLPLLSKQGTQLFRQQNWRWLAETHFDGVEWVFSLVPSKR
jgi:hypothetical protein